MSLNVTLYASFRAKWTNFSSSSQLVEVGKRDVSDVPKSYDFVFPRVRFLEDGRPWFGPFLIYTLPLKVRGKGSQILKAVRRQGLLGAG